MRTTTVVVMTDTDQTTAPSATVTPGPVPPRRLIRNRRDKVFAGVASGIADYTGLPTMLVRVLFLASAFMGWGLLLYPVLWIAMPEQ